MSRLHGPSNRITRREFLITTGLGLAALATGCKLAGDAPPPAKPASTGKELLYQATPQAAPQGTPDLILRNSKVLTVDAANSVVQAVAVKDGLIQATGSHETIDALKGAATQVIDLNGKTMTPGLIDPHFHLAYLDLLNQMIPFLPPDVETIPDMVRKLAEVAAQTPTGEWIQIYYLTLKEKRMPERQELDKVSAEHPVWILQQGGHMGCANSLALQMANITAETPNPPGGVIERDKNGIPTGIFYNHRAMNVLRKAMPPKPEDTTQKSIREGQPLLLANGITTFHDVYAYGVNIFDSYIQAARNGEMALRGAVYPVLENPGETEVAKGLEHYKDAFMRLGGFKLQVDGSASTAYCHEETNGTRWDMPSWPIDAFKKTVRTLHDIGLQVCVHCVGDAGVDLTLDAFEEAMNANPRPDPRHRIEHCILSKPASTQRIKDLGIVVSNTPNFILMAGDYYVDLWGPRRSERIIVSREWIEAGIPMSLGSDYPTTPWDRPQMTLGLVMERRTNSGKVLNADQGLTFEQALRAHTIGSAYAGFEEGIKGSIEPGKLADLAVWAQDPSSVDVKELALNTMIDKTFVGGKLVYQAA